MFRKDEFVSVLVEVKEQHGQIVEKKSIIRAVNCSKNEKFEAMLFNGKGIINLPRNSKFLIFHEMEEKGEIIPADHFVVETTNNLEKIVLNVIRPIYIQDFGIVEKDCFEEILVSKFWKRVTKLKSEGKKITDYAIAILNGKEINGVVFATFEP